jgi:trigger factor
LRPLVQPSDRSASRNAAASRSPSALFARPIQIAICSIRETCSPRAAIRFQAGEQRLVKVTFPTNYQAAELAGKEAEFDVTAKSIDAPGTVKIDDEFAKSLGLESLDKLREAVKDRITREHAGMSRQKLKRALLDKLDEMHKFNPPPTLVEDEFSNVWKAIEDDLKQQGRTFADEDTTEEKAREEYRAIANRRVRLGLVLAEIGERNNITVTEEEIKRAIVDRARKGGA